MDDWPTIAAWRRSRRPELIERRLALAPEARRAAAAAINAALEQAFPIPSERAVGFCWPYRGEVDVRFAIRTMRTGGATAAMPVVVAMGRPLEFRQWWPGAPMAPGPLSIPAPVGTPVVVPYAAFVPLVGFDGQGFRLGYGAGLFDRTLAALVAKPIAVGVGHELARMPTIHPQPHDIPMDFIVTETGICAVEPGGLLPLSAVEARERAQCLAERRRL